MKQEWDPGFSATPRGFELVLFEDAYGAIATVQQSSVIGEYEDADTPGTSALWVGLGTEQRMHLSREHVAGLRDLLDRWLTTGRLEEPLRVACDSEVAEDGRST